MKLTLIHEGSSNFHTMSNLSLKMGIYCHTLGHRLSQQIIIAGISLIFIGCSASVAMCQTKWFSENTNKITLKKTFFWKYNIKKNPNFSAILVINYFNLKLFSIFFLLFLIFIKKNVTNSKSVSYKRIYLFLKVMKLFFFWIFVKNIF